MKSRVDHDDFVLGLRKLDRMESYPPQRCVGAAAIDIIFVHGLGGSAIKAWAHAKSQQFWPEWIMEIPELSEARLYTFGYDANWMNIFGPQNALGVQGFAAQLLDNLSLHYQSNGEVASASIEIAEQILATNDIYCPQFGWFSCQTGNGRTAGSLLTSSRP